MDYKKVNSILEEYLFSDIEDEDVRQEICERIASLSDDPDVEVLVSGNIDSEHEGIMAEVTEHGQVTEFVMSQELIDLPDEEDE
jgi:hypothetical protein